MNIKQLLFTAGAAFLLAACTSNENIGNEQKETVEIENITITEEPFEPEAPSTTRAAQAPQVVDLGDGITAEVSFVEDTETEQPAQTRAAIADGHYTIYATKPVPGSTPGDGSGTYMGKFSGTVHDGKFVHDASSPKMRLPADTYTFVCVNDAFPYNSAFELTNDLDNPQMATVTMPISGNRVEIPFVMKHRDISRVRFQITSYTNEGHGISGKLSLSSTTVRSLYDIEGRPFGALPGNFTSGTYTFAESPVATSAYTQVIKRTTDYRYFLSGVQGTNAQFTIDAGTIYGKSLAGKSFPLTAISQLQENKSYTCNIKLKPSLLYLFQDGTVGVLAEKGTRTPIGIVLEDKTSTKDGTAIALDIAPVSLYPIVTGYQGVMWDRRTPPLSQANNKLCPTHAAAIADMDGYKYTWEAAGSADGVTIKANSLDYPAFYIAARYGNQLAANGITVSGSMVGRKWYLPAYGELLKLRNVFGSTLPMPNQLNDSHVIDPATMARIDAAFTAAGAPALSSHDNPGNSWTSTETDPEAAVNYYPDHLGADNAAGKGKSAFAYFQVIPFVHF